MNVIAQLFWDPTDRRLRALWRLILHALLIVGGMMALTLLPGVSVGVGGGETDAAPNALKEVTPMLIYGLVVVAATLLAARFFDRRPISDLGLQLSVRWWRDLIFGLLLGALLMFLIFLIELALGWVTIEGAFVTSLPLPFGVAFIAFLVLFASVGSYEELMSRGYHFKNLAEGLNFGPLGRKVAIFLALLISAVIFGLLHAGNPSATTLSTFNIFLAGVFLSVPVLLTDELAISIGAHIAWNFFQGNVFGFPVSGNTVFRTTVIDVAQGGPDLWTGGAFGPEAGLLGIAAMIAGSLLMIWWVKRTRGTVGFAHSLAEYQESGQ